MDEFLLAAPPVPRARLSVPYPWRACAVPHVIATKGRPEVLREALLSAVASLPQEGEMIVVDGDPERSAEAVVEELDRPDGGPQIHYIAGVTGLCAQRNRGMDAARGDVVIFTDDDCTLAPGFYEALAEAYRDPDVIGVTGRVLQAPDTRIGSNIESPLRRMVLGGGRQGTMTSFGFRRPIIDVEDPRTIEYMPGRSCPRAWRSPGRCGSTSGWDVRAATRSARTTTSPTGYRAEGRFATRPRRPSIITRSASARWTGARWTGSW